MMMIDLLGFPTNKPNLHAGSRLCCLACEKENSANSTHYIVLPEVIRCTFHCNWCITVVVLLKTIKPKDIMANQAIISIC